ncbi:MAG: response regulator [Deltaproteobacteria bacterium]|nr:response regulator [Deltaproteobacteria bacterium]
MLDAIFANAPFALQIFDRAGRSILTNGAFLTLFGSEPPASYSVLDDEIARRSGVQGLIEAAFRGETITIPTTWYDPRLLGNEDVTEGNLVAIQATFLPLRDFEGAVGHVAAVFKDLTAEMHARDQLQSERDLMTLIIEQSGDGIVVANQDGVIDMFNPAAARQHGVQKLSVTPDEWGRVYGLFTEQGAPLPLTSTPLYRALHGEKIEGERWRVRRPDGTVRTLSGTASPLTRPDGTRAGAVLTTRDETDRIAGEQERAELLARERTARADAERANRTKDEFLAMLGHELRNPLAPIRTALDLLDLRSTDAPSRELQVIRRQVDHLTRLVDDLLDVSRITGGKIEIRRRNVAIDAVVQRAVEMASPMFEQRRQRLTVDVAPADCIVVSGDADRLAQVFSNLLTNASKFSPSEATIAMRAYRSGEEVVIEVEDSGIGIEPSMLDRVFDVFVQGKLPSTARGGLGLGLAIVKSLVELHHGQVSVHSPGPGRGSTFCVRLRAIEDRIHSPPTDPGLRRSTSSRKVLVVDDNVDAAELLAALLASAGHEVMVAHDGPSAIALLDRFTPSVAVLDLGLPVMDGYELAAALRQRLEPSSLVLIALSGYGQPDDRARTAAAGFHEHLAKPTNRRRILDAVESVPATDA